MRAYAIDERDSKTEEQASYFRVIVVDGAWSAYNIDGATPEEAHDWAERHRGDGRYALAVRVERSDGGVDLIWLTEPPEALAD